MKTHKKTETATILSAPPSQNGQASNLSVSGRSFVFKRSASIALAAGALVFGITMPAHAQTIQTYNQPGNYPFTVPAGVTSIKISLVGGGAGGGGGGGDAFFGGSGAGGGGGGGGGSATCSFIVRAGNEYTITVGRGGTSGTAGGTAQNGGPGGNGGTSAIRDGVQLLLGVNAFEEVATGGYGGGGGAVANFSGTSPPGSGGYHGSGLNPQNLFPPELRLPIPPLPPYALCRTDGNNGEDGLRGAGNRGGAGGAAGGVIPASCNADTGRGGGGGRGYRRNTSSGEPMPAVQGTAGADGCVVLEY